MNYIRLVAFLLCVTCTLNGQQTQTPALRHSIEDQIKSITNIMVNYQAQFEVIGNEFKRIEKRDDLSETDRKKVEALAQSNDKAKLELLSVRTNIEEINIALKKRGDDIDGLKGALEKIVSEKEKLDVIKTSIDRLEKAPEGFKAFTRMSYKGSSRESRIDLEASIGGKRIPLVDKKVSVSLQYKDGPLTGTEEFKTDNDGIVRVAKISSRGMPAPTYRVFRFDGDATNRPSQTRVKIR